MILSIDVGLRNLSMCIMDSSDKKDISSYIIHFWDVCDTLNSDDYKCKGVQKNGKICGRKCSLKYSENTSCSLNYSCKTHFPKSLSVKKSNIFKKKEEKHGINNKEAGGPDFNEFIRKFMNN